MFGVLNQLRQRGRAGSEIQQKRLVGPGGLVGAEPADAGRSVAVTEPARDRLTDRDPQVRAGDLGKPVGNLGPGDHRADLATINPVTQVCRPEQGGRRDEDRTELHRGERGLPQLDLIAEQDKDPGTASDALRPQPGRHLIRAVRHLGKGVRRVASIFLDDPQRRLVRAFERQDRVEPVDREVEVLWTGHLNPARAPP